MKAKELAQMWNNNRTLETLQKIGNDYWHEIRRLSIARNVKTDSGYCAILDELDQKWVAMAKMSEGILQDGFQVIVKTEMPDVYRLWMPRRGKMLEETK